MRIPHADKRRGPLQAMPAASWSRLWRSLRPCGREYRLIRARRWPPRGWVRRPASWACRGATAAGNAMAKHWARVARRRDCAAFGYVVNRATSDRVQPLRFSFWLAVGRGAAVGRSGHGGEGESPHGGLGVQPPAVETTIGCGRDAGISGSRAAALLVRDPTGERRLAFLRNAKMPY